MKTLAILCIVFLTNSALAQIRDSAYIQSCRNLAVKDKQILTYFQPTDFNKPVELMLFDGFNWNKISQDSIPTIHNGNSEMVFSKFSNHIYITGITNLWEYDGKNWKKYFIDDSLRYKRVFREIIELPDSSFVVTAFSEFVKIQSGNITILEKIFHELLLFKEGKFTPIRTRWTDKNTRVGIFQSFQQLKEQSKGNYTYYTPLENSNGDSMWELVTFSPTHQILKKDSIPDLSKYGFTMPEFVEINDYLYDSKGSLWFAMYSRNPNPFVSLLEKRENGDLLFYGENIGIPTFGISKNLSMDIDEDDNIWFSPYNQVVYPPMGSSIYNPILCKLYKDRKTLQTYDFNLMLDRSIWYIGGFTDWKFEDPGSFHLVKVHEGANSILLCSDIPMLQFFPNKETTVKEIKYQSIHLYPNPVQSNNTIYIESRSFENVVNPLNIIIRDVSGATIREETISSNGTKLQINSQDLLSGTYFVSVLSNNKTILQTKFIKE